MTTIWKRSYPIKETKYENNIKAEVMYQLGGMNPWNGDNEKRGYYLYITPVMYEKQDGYVMEGITVGKGIKVLLNECHHKSKKAEETAINKALCVCDYYVDRCAEEYNLELAE